MRIIRFTIKGNGIEPDGQALPKAKLTRGQQWTEKAQRYVKWKQHVVDAYLREVREDILYNFAVIYLAQKNKPIGDYGLKAHIEIVAHYKNRKHPDTENVLGSIADALFVNDSHLAGRFDFTVGSERAGSVDVTLKFPYPLKMPKPKK